MRQEVQVTVKVTMVANAELTQGGLLKFIAEMLAPLQDPTPELNTGIVNVELLGVLEEAEIYHPEGIA